MSFALLAIFGISVALGWDIVALPSFGAFVVLVIQDIAAEWRQRRTKGGAK